MASGISWGAVIGAVIGAIIGYFTPIGVVYGAILGYTIGLMLDPPKQKHERQPIEIQDLQYNTFQQNYPVPIVDGEAKVFGEIMWIGNARTAVYKRGGGGGWSGGSSKPVTYHVFYYADFAMCLSEGVISGVKKIWVNDVEVTGNAGWAIYTGTSTQTPDQCVRADSSLHPFYPAWRNTAYARYSGLLGQFNRIPVVSALVLGILTYGQTVCSAETIGVSVFGAWASSDGSQFRTIKEYVSSPPPMTYQSVIRTGKYKSGSKWKAFTARDYGEPDGGLWFRHGTVLPSVFSGDGKEYVCVWGYSNHMFLFEASSLATPTMIMTTHFADAYQGTHDGNGHFIIPRGTSGIAKYTKNLTLVATVAWTGIGTGGINYGYHMLSWAKRSNSYYRNLALSDPSSPSCILEISWPGTSGASVTIVMSYVPPAPYAVRGGVACSEPVGEQQYVYACMSYVTSGATPFYYIHHHAVGCWKRVVVDNMVTSVFVGLVPFISAAIQAQVPSAIPMAEHDGILYLHYDDKISKVTFTEEGGFVEHWDGKSYTFEFTETSANPAWCVLDFLTNTRYGCGIPVSRIDMESFLEVATYCGEQVYNPVSNNYEARYAIDVWMNSKKSALDWLKELLTSFLGYLVWSDGKLRLRVERQVDLSTCREYTEDSIVEGSFVFSETRLAEMYNRVEVEFVNMENEWRHEVFPLDANCKQDLDGEVRPYEISFLCVKRPSQAARLARYFLDVIQLCRIKCKFKTDIYGLKQEVGDVILVTHSRPRPAWVKKPFRVVKITESEEDIYELDCVEYIAGLYSDEDPRGSASVVVPAVEYYGEPAQVVRVSAAMDVNLDKVKIYQSIVTSSGQYGRSSIYVKKPGQTAYSLLNESAVMVTPSGWLERDISSSAATLSLVGILGTPPASGDLLIFGDFGDYEEVSYSTYNEDDRRFYGLSRGRSGTEALAWTALTTNVPVVKVYRQDSSTVFSDVTSSVLHGSGSFLFGANSYSVYVGFYSKPRLVTFTTTAVGTSVEFQPYYSSLNEQTWSSVMMTDTSSGFLRNSPIIIEVPDNQLEWAQATLSETIGGVETVITTASLHWLKLQKTGGSSIYVTGIYAGVGRKVSVKEDIFEIPVDYTSVGTWMIRVAAVSVRDVEASLPKAPEVVVYAVTSEEMLYAVQDLRVNGMSAGSVVFP